MIVILFRLLIFIAMILLLYTAYKYIMNPKRKLEVAKEKKTFYFHDDTENIKKNFLMTYKGFMFEGEKYLGTTEKSFDVVNISVHAHNPGELKGLERNDLYFLEEEILIRYPFASIEWKHPINKLIINKV
ncbi:sigma-w pathway protein ysdB [Aquibacillus koreensis]|uniref:Sigma-w pathway protein ysdB n=1 Tax=Aquibacillus koreensis TaxID=279446 RepID=A0A9X3WLB4_9BACI|nr:sigma-w pathway protein ysdB [Aquibacillus koreensis]MCT2535058.1 sigma-w pathway protein ysdB [Aquibacillus koreensis]MDC3419221.1 sigma-w pathway protein ysdB [Aquibacillus koreensis]